MSRSNPQSSAPNPAQRFFEWNGEKGAVRFYDKDLKENITLPLPFQFLLLDQLGSVRGWHDASDSGIYSNEVRDTRQDVLIVKAFKGGTLAEGIYRDIRDKVCSRSIGGQFTANLYIAFKRDSALAIGCLAMKGAALNAWVEFSKAHRKELFEKAVAITDFTQHRKGKIDYRMPVFELRPLSPETNSQAVELDKQLQAWLETYLKRTKHEQVAEPLPEQEIDSDRDNTPIPDEDPIPF